VVSLDLFRNAHDFQTFFAGTTVFRAGESGDVAYVVRTGEVEIRLDDRLLYVVTAGGLVGEMALIDSAPRSATAVARTDAELVPIDEKRFLFLVQQTPFFALQVMRVLAERLRASNQR
jgi:CRP-like cAMP-binding protein